MNPEHGANLTGEEREDLALALEGAAREGSSQEAISDVYRHWREEVYGLLPVVQRIIAARLVECPAHPHRDPRNEETPMTDDDLAAVIAADLNESNFVGWFLCNSDNPIWMERTPEEEIARVVVAAASDWLAARDARVRAEASELALDVAIDAVCDCGSTHGHLPSCAAGPIIMHPGVIPPREDDQ